MRHHTASTFALYTVVLTILYFLMTHVIAKLEIFFTLFACAHFGVILLLRFAVVNVWLADQIIVVCTLFALKGTLFAYTRALCAVLSLQIHEKFIITLLAYFFFIVVFLAIHLLFLLFG